MTAGSVGGPEEPGHQPGLGRVGFREAIEAEIASGEFDGYRANGTVWRDGDGVGE